MYLVTLTNFGTGRQFESFAEAKAWAIKTGFEASVMLNGQLVGAFSPINGFWRNPVFY
jgi:hypothetical protein